MQINHFADFCNALYQCGFSMGGGSAKGIFALIYFGWEEQPQNTPICWHTGDPETDPWEWRMRVLEERTDIAYSKVFFGTSGYITKEWYPYFLAVRRRGESFEEAYESGTVSQMAKRIYDVVSENGVAALHEIKQMLSVTKEEQYKFEKAIVELQMRMFLTMCGRAQKVSKNGEAYGWNSTVFTTTEAFWKERNTQLPVISPEEAYKKIDLRILELNPEAKEKDRKKFICG